MKKDRSIVLKWIRLSVIMSFVVGILLANFLNSGQGNVTRVWNTYFIEKFQYKQIHSTELFGYILVKRLPVLIILVFLTTTKWGMISQSIFLMWETMAAGFLMALVIMIYRVKGIPVMGVLLFPQYLIYIPVYMVCLRLALFFRERNRESLKIGKRFLREALLFLGIGVMLCMVFVTGIFLESYINPRFLKIFLKKF